MNKNLNYTTLVLLHIALGLIIFLFRPFAKVYFFVILAFFLIKIITSTSKDRVINVLLACSYFVGAEVLFRMTKSSIAYEASKYLVILFVITGVFFKGLSGKAYPYFISLILLVPGILVASTTLSFDANFRTSVAFVLSGPVCLGIASLFCYDRKISFNQLMQIIMYLSLPIIAMTVYIFLYNPSVKETLSGTASNSATSGGFGPNQVATVLGLGMVTLVIRFFLKSPTLGLKILNAVLLGAMTYRAIVTFSRGGIFAAAIVIAAFLWSLFRRSSFNQKSKIVVYVGFLVVVIATSWFVSSSQTLGLIDKRYANQDALGREKDDVTTGRVDLFIEEINGFLTSPFVGIGTSRTKDIRVEREGHHLPSHNEVGRLLSEHGLLGIIILSILIFKPLSYRSYNRKNLFFYTFLAFWFATINHSGMRIAAPAFIYALALLNITNENTVRRQLPK